MARLPLELVDLILSELLWPFPFSNSLFVYDKTDLISCTLVCRAWKELSASHLFCSIAYSFSYTLDDLVPYPTAINSAACPRWTTCTIDDVTGEAIPVPYKTFNQLHDFVNANAKVKSSIKHLRLRGYTRGEGIEDEWTVSPHALTSLLHMLPNLRSLHLIDIAPSPSIPCNDGIFAVTQPLDFLHVEYSDTFGLFPVPYTQIDTARLLACFGNVDRLLIMPTETDHEGTTRFRDIHHLRPRALYLDGEHSPDDLLSCMSCDQQVLGAVRGLHLLDSRQVPAQSIASLVMTRMASALEELSIDVFNDILWLRPINPFSLAAGNALKVLTLSVDMYDISPTACCRAFDAMVPFLRSSGLSRSTNPHFHSLIIRCRIRDVTGLIPNNATITEEDEDALGRNGLDETLGHLAERLDLKVITVEYSLESRCYREAAEQMLSYMLPKLKEKRYLRLLDV